MPDTVSDLLSRSLERDPQALLEEWLTEQLRSSSARADLMTDAEVRQQSSEFLVAFRDALGRAGTDVKSSDWDAVRDLLGRASRSRALKGFSPAETARFVFSLKQPLFTRLRTEAEVSSDALGEAVWEATCLLDELALHTTEVAQRSRDEVIQRQQQELLELSTPVVKLWQGVVAVPLIGTLDSARTQVVMESLLERIVDTEATIAIIDITGVPTVDTLVAQHLLKTVAAARLMGAECIISGIRPQIAQTIVHLGVELTGAVTKATFADAIAAALRMSGWRISRVAE